MDNLVVTGFKQDEVVLNFFTELFGRSKLQNDSFRIRHSIFKWSVENIFSFPANQPTSFCESPIFMLKETWWFLRLCPREKVEGIEYILLQLHRQKEDPGPTKVFASFRLGLENSSNKIWFHTSFYEFPKGFSITYRTSVLGSLEDFFNDVEDNANILSVLCEIYISEVSNEDNIVREISEIDENLFINMNQIFDTQKGTDVIIEISGRRITAHKCILSARSKTLAKQLENGIANIRLSCNFLCLQSVMRYIYTGRFDFLAKNRIFSIGLYEIAFDLSLYSLSDLLIPHQIFKYTKIDVLTANKGYTLTVHNPQSPDQEKTFFDMNLGISLTVLMRKIDNEVMIKVMTGGIPKGYYRQIRVILANRNREVVENTVTQNSFSPDKCAEVAALHFSLFTFKFEDFLIGVCTDGKITVQVAYAVFSQRYMSDIINLPSFIQKPFRPIGAQLCQEMSGNLFSTRQNFSIKKVSEDLKKLLESKRLSDFTLIADGKRFSTHRCILAARILCFNRNYNYLHSRSGLTVNSKSRTVELLLAYLYCGTLSHLHGLSAEDFVDLFKLSKTLGIPSLTVVCVMMVYFTLGPELAPVLLKTI